MPPGRPCAPRSTILFQMQGARVVVLARYEMKRLLGETAGPLSGRDRPPSLAYLGKVAEREEDTRPTAGKASPGSRQQTHHQSISAMRFTAGLSGFLILIQSAHR